MIRVTVTVVEASNADRYDGTNGAYIASLYQQANPGLGFQIESDDGSTLVLSFGNPSDPEHVSIQNGEWVRWRECEGVACVIIGVIPNPQLTRDYVRISW